MHNPHLPQSPDQGTGHHAGGVTGQSVPQETGPALRGAAADEALCGSAADEFSRVAYRVSLVSIIWNVLLSGFKFFAGIFAHSGAMISDAIHSASDIVSTVVVIIGVKLSSAGPDAEHPYGHERMECIAALILSGLLFITGFGIGLDSLRKIIGALNGEMLVIPGRLALAAAITSIAVKEAMYWYTAAAAKRINSSALWADAWHHRSDALSSVGTLAGIGGARLGLPVLDPLAAGVVCLLILKVAYDIAADAVSKLVDRSCTPETLEEIRRLAAAQPQVYGIKKIYTRLFGSRFYVEIEVLAHSTMDLTEAHQLSHAIHDAVEAAFPNIKCCRVYVLPATAPHRQLLEEADDEEQKVQQARQIFPAS
ncbi:MAG: cation diffusion facilitator family transporter [Peptococcaceae bacterium]|nr:cation diffusion facilitator family transporter [Peptococcaceae bacterium]